MEITAKTLKKYYDLFSQWSTGELHKKEVTILGHKVTLLYTVSISNELSVDCELDDVEMDNPTVKFFDECQSVFDGDLYSSSYVQDLLYDISIAMEKKLKPLLTILPNYRDRRNFYRFMFNENGLIRTLDEVKLLYKNRDIVQPKVQVPISSSYTAVIEKGKNIQVGCQSIPIETVRKIVEEYEKLNK